MFDDELWLDPHYSLVDKAQSAVLEEGETGVVGIFVQMDLPGSATNSGARMQEIRGIWLLWNSPKARVICRTRSHASRTVDRELSPMEFSEIDELVERNRLWDFSKGPARIQSAPVAHSSAAQISVPKKFASQKFIARNRRPRPSLVPDSTTGELDPRNWVQSTTSLGALASPGRSAGFIIRDDRRLWHDFGLLFSTDDRLARRRLRPRPG
jgi:hypothetical protein